MEIFHRFQNISNKRIIINIIIAMIIKVNFAHSLAQASAFHVLRLMTFSPAFHRLNIALPCGMIVWTEWV